MAGEFGAGYAASGYPSQPDHPAAFGYAAQVGAEIDRVFRAGMDRARECGGRDLVARHGGSATVGVLVEFRTSLGWPGRVVSWPQVDAVARYRSAADLRAAVAAHVERGTLASDGRGMWATEAGLAFLNDLYTHHGTALAEVWPAERVATLAALAGRLVAAATLTGGEAFAAMAPPFEPPGLPAGALLLNRLSALRYHRADAHAAAWQAAGLTAAGIEAMPAGPERDAIEADTNRRAAPPFAVLSAREREAFLAGLRGLA